MPGICLLKRCFDFKTSLQQVYAWHMPIYWVSVGVMFHVVQGQTPTSKTLHDTHSSNPSNCHDCCCVVWYLSTYVVSTTAIHQWGCPNSPGGMAQQAGCPLHLSWACPGLWQQVDLACEFFSSLVLWTGLWDKRMHLSSVMCCSTNLMSRWQEDRIGKFLPEGGGASSVSKWAYAWHMPAETMF